MLNAQIKNIQICLFGYSGLCYAHNEIKYVCKSFFWKMFVWVHNSICRLKKNSVTIKKMLVMQFPYMELLTSIFLTKSFSFFVRHTELYDKIRKQFCCRHQKNVSHAISIHGSYYWHFLTKNFSFF